MFFVSISRQITRYSLQRAEKDIFEKKRNHRSFCVAVTNIKIVKCTLDLFIISPRMFDLIVTAIFPRHQLNYDARTPDK